MGIRVLVASHIRLYREALGRVLEQAREPTIEQTREQTRQPTSEPTPEVVLVGLAASATDAVEQVRRLAPDIALLDMAMSDAFSVARHLTRFAGASRIVALGMAENGAGVLNCAQPGIGGCERRE